MKRSEAIDALKDLLLEFPKIIAYCGEDEGCHLHARNLLDKIENWKWLSDEEWEPEDET
jgi:hypothetical protein